MNDRFKPPGDPSECQVYRTEAELYVTPGSGWVRVRRNSTWFDRLGQVQSQEETEWEGPVSALFPSDPSPLSPDLSSLSSNASPLFPDARLRRTASTVRRVRRKKWTLDPNRLADLVALTAVAALLFAVWRFLT